MNNNVSCSECNSKPDFYFHIFSAIFCVLFVGLIFFIKKKMNAKAQTDTDAYYEH
jgi:hypothetical protein